MNGSFFKLLTSSIVDSVAESLFCSLLGGKVQLDNLSSICFIHMVEIHEIYTSLDSKSSFNHCVSLSDMFNIHMKTTCGETDSVLSSSSQTPFHRWGFSRQNN